MIFPIGNVAGWLIWVLMIEVGWGRFFLRGKGEEAGSDKGFPLMWAFFPLVVSLGGSFMPGGVVLVGEVIVGVW